jgi:O-antigen/teichoic acid export membrane protein
MEPVRTDDYEVVAGLADAAPATLQVAEIPEGVAPSRWRVFGREGSSRRRLIENIFSLYILQGLNYVLPLAVLPYLVRVLGMEMYGLVAFCQSFAQYFVILTDYGFNFSATRYIAQHRDSAENVSSMFCRVFLIKLSLMLVGLVLLVCIVELVPRFHEDAWFFLVAYIAVLGNVLFPQWYFQGVEKMKYISIITGTAKIGSAALLFIFVRRPGDALLALGIQSLGPWLAGLAGLWLSVREIGLRFRWPAKAEFRETLSEGWHLFVSTAAVSLYTNTNVFLVGLLAGNVQAGYFSVAEKLVRGAQAGLTPVMQAMFPHVSSLTSKSRDSVLRFLRKSLLVIGGMAFAGSTLLFLLAHPVALILFGPKSLACVPTLRWIAMLPFVIAISNVLGIQTMIPFGLDRQFSRILIAAGLANIVLAVPLIRLFGASGAGASVLLIEIFVTTTMAVVLGRSGIDILPLRRQAA